EDEAAGGLLVRFDRACPGLAWQRIRRPAGEACQKLCDAEILQRAAEDHRRKVALAERLGIERGQVAQTQLQAFQRRLRNAVLDCGMRVKRLNVRQLLGASER